MAKEKTYTKHMSLKEILSYSIGLFGFQAVIFYINSYAAEFYSRTMGANIAIVGVILLVAKVVSAVFDPVVGNMIEKQTGGKCGKLKPFIFWSIPFLIVLTILCFVKLPVSGVPMYIIIFVLFTLWSMAMTLGDVPSQGIAAVLTPDITERTNVLSIANTFKSIGQAAPYVVVPVIAWIIPGGLDGFNPGYMSSAEYLVSAIFIAVVGCAMLSMICFFNKERVPYQAEKMTFKEMFGALKGNKPLVLVLVSYFLGFARQGAMAIQVQASTVIVGTPSKIIILGITTAAGTMISMAMTPLLIKKFDEKKVFIGMSVYGFVISFVSYFATVASNYNMIVMLATLFLLGLQFGAVNIMPMIMVADSVDYYEWKTGRRTEGVAYAVLSFAIKVTLAMGTALALILVGAFGYESIADASSIEPAIKNGVFFTYTAVPGITSLLAAIPIFFYDLVGGKKKQITAELAERRNQTGAACAEAEPQA